MLPNLHHQNYIEFQQALAQLQQTAADPKVDTAQLQQQFQAVQRLFQQRILSLAASELAPTDEPRVRSYHTEINKQLRLLSMDVVFLGAARQPGTVQGRQSQILLRIQTLIDYCNGILQLNS